MYNVLLGSGCVCIAYIIIYATAETLRKYINIINTFIIKFSLKLCESRIGQCVDVVILIDRKIDGHDQS